MAVHGQLGRKSVGTFAAAVIVGAVAMAVRLIPARTNAFWQDEVASARILLRPALAALRRVAGTESTPPAWYTLAWITHRFGVPITDVRLLSVLCGALSAGIVVVYAARLLPLSTAALAGFLLALGWEPLMHGWELRAYALYMLTSLVFVLLLEASAASPTPWRLAALGGCVALGSLTHYFFLLTLASGLLWLWIAPELRHQRGRLTAGCAVGLLPLCVWSPAAVAQFRHGAYSWIGPVGGRGVADVYGHLFLRSLPKGTLGFSVGLALLGLVVFGAVRLWRHSASGRLCALAAVVPVVVAAAASLAGANVFAARNLLGVAPFAAVGISAAVAALPRRAVPFAAAVGILMTVIAHTNSDRPPPPFDGITRALVAEGWQPEDPILLLTPPFTYLYPIGWYLPAHEELVLAEPKLGRACASVFVVSVRGLSASPDLQQRIGKVLVARVPWTATIWDELSRRGGAVAAAKEHMPPCVRPQSS